MSKLKYILLILTVLFSFQVGVTQSSSNTYQAINAGEPGSIWRTKTNEAIDYANIEAQRKFWIGKNVVWFGDSQTLQGDDDTNAWILTLCRLMGWTFNVSNVLAVSGTGFMPYNNSGGGDFSFYKRADDVAAKTPDIIIVLGGENDDINLTITTSEAAYTGATLPPGDPGLPGIVGAIKGTLKKLRDQNPNAVIVLMTNFIIDGTATDDIQKEVNRHLACRDYIAPLYQVTYLPNYQVQKPAAIHWPPLPDGKRIGEWIARQGF